MIGTVLLGLLSLIGMKVLYAVAQAQRYKSVTRSLSKDVSPRSERLTFGLVVQSLAWSVWDRVLEFWIAVS
jgi:hypothetical protein